MSERSARRASRTRRAGPGHREAARTIQSTPYHSGASRPEIILTRERLRGSAVRVASAVDRPLDMMNGAGRLTVSCTVASAGADDLDVGLSIGPIKDRAYAELCADLEAVMRAAAAIPVKAMLELPLLSPEQRYRGRGLSGSRRVPSSQPNSRERNHMHAAPAAISPPNPCTIRWSRE